FEPLRFVPTRLKEYGVIDEKLDHERVWFVPKTKFGIDVSLEALEHEWGFNTVILALGAWRDRPLPLDGAEELVGKGLVYQNPLIYWFNHKHEASYEGAQFETPDGAIVIGGGLASVDVAKVMMLETVTRALRERGIEVDMVEMEHKGIDKTLAAHDLTYESLDLKGATLFYRKRREDMPLVAIPPAADEKRIEKIHTSRARLADKAQSKYLFKIEPLMSPESLIVEDGNVTGVRFRRMEHRDGSFVKTDDLVERRGRVVVSSIGSIPEPLPGVPMKGELFDFEVLDAEKQVVRLNGHPTVYAAGNAVTGKGNIAASRKHGTEIAGQVAAWLLGESDVMPVDPEHNRKNAEAVGEAVADELAHATPLSNDEMSALRARVEGRWNEIGFDGNYSAWIESVGRAS
ncbi:MAG: hypothetical protein AAF658_00815, partial [Myxococcota bacterium]